jgi:hypothetical protein
MRELRFWPMLFGVYFIVLGLESLRLRIPIAISLDRISVTDLAIFGIVVGVWLLGQALRNQDSRNDTKNTREHGPGM